MNWRTKMVEVYPPPSMPRLPPRLTARPRSFHAATVRADRFEARWTELRRSLEAAGDELTLELLLRIEDRCE